MLIPRLGLLNELPGSYSIPKLIEVVVKLQKEHNFLKEDKEKVIAVKLQKEHDCFERI